MRVRKFFFQTESFMSSIRMRELLVKIGHLCMYLHQINFEKQNQQQQRQRQRRMMNSMRIFRRNIMYVKQVIDQAICYLLSHAF